jgi:GNAT superfamily N-acetyltransferase
MADKVSISEAHWADIHVLSTLIRSSFSDVAGRFGLTPQNCPKHPSNCTDEWVEKDMNRGVAYFILESSSTPVGCGALEQVDSELCYLERLAVLPEERRKGYGRALVDHIINLAKSHGRKQMSIGIIAADSELKQWYTKIGFVEGETKEYSHLPFLVTFMKYDLKCRK